MTLTRKQRLFIEEYLTCWNASEAARRAGYTGKANVAGPRLLAKDSIQAAIEARLKEKAMTADEVLARMTDQARASMADFLRIEEDKPKTKDKEGEEEQGPRYYLAGIDWDQVRRLGHLIKRITPTKWGYTIELVDNQAALTNLGKHHRLFDEHHQVEHSGEIQVPGLDEALRKIYGGEDDGDHGNSGA